MRLIVLSWLLAILFSVSDIRAEDCAEFDVSCWQQKAEQGDATAQFNLGVMYDQGLGVVQNYVQAHKFFNIAAARSTGGDQEQAARAIS